MNNELIRALKDRNFRKTATLADAHPAGIAEIDEALLADAAGGTYSTMNCHYSDGILCGHSATFQVCREL